MRGATAPRHWCRVTIAALALAACARPEHAVPEEGRYEYVARYALPGGGGLAEVRGVLVITDADAGQIVGQWEATALHPEAADGRWKETAYEIEALPGDGGRLIHQVWIEEGSLRCEGRFQITLQGGQTPETPLECWLWPEGESPLPGTVPAFNTPQVRPIDGDSLPEPLEVEPGYSEPADPRR